MKKIVAIIIALVLTLSFAACSSESDEKVIKVGASPAPHAEILEVAKEVLAKDGWTLEIVEFTDYVLPNETLSAGEIDANYFQHTPYLNTYNEEKGTDIVAAAVIHYEPLGVYPGKTASLDDIAEGAQIAIPNDGSNEARALYLLQDLGLITVDNTNGYNITVLDIVDNPLNLDIIEAEAAQLPNILADIDFAVINGNYAIGAGIDGNVLATEATDSDAAQTYGNVIAVRNGEEETEKTLALIKAVQSEEVKAFIEETYGISVVALF